MAARKTAWHPDKVRERIRTSQLINRLTDHVLGKVEMKPSQVTAALGLLRKTVPDLSSVEHSGEIAHRHTTELSDAELAHIAAGGRAGAAQTQTSPPEPAGIH